MLSRGEWRFSPLLDETLRLLRRSRELSGARALDNRKMNAAHTRIVYAILKGDGQEAEEAMLEHLHRVGLDLISDSKR